MRQTRTALCGVSVVAAFLIVLSSALPDHSSASPATEDSLARITANLPFSMRRIETPPIPARAVSVTEFGGVGDGTSLNTAAFAKAIEACAKSGGGRVVVPQGIWLTGPIQLKSNIDLHVERGAVIQFSPRVDDYPLVRTTWEGSPAVRRMSPIYAVQLENISITGQGVLDGAGDAWRMVKKSKLTEARGANRGTARDAHPRNRTRQHSDLGAHRCCMRGSGANQADESADHAIERARDLGTGQPRRGDRKSPTRKRERVSASGGREEPEHKNQSNRFVSYSQGRRVR